MRHQHIRGLDDENKIPTSCAHDCGGKCLLYVYIQKGKIMKISAPTTLPGAIRRIPQRACIRGLTYHRRVYHPDRLKRPMRRIGKRGKANSRRFLGMRP
ncbi:MAG: hypothetical protein GTN80_09370 [Nitrososphaeria archaeon]|nr:hypothetical protein [Nitrososphaeria archaeon]NIN53364.1 hypothetical protein [Nitrososphaeria archaeon]NIQ33830.1 hypothetical protein [Nitrososphaeria archaeon]